MLDVAIAYNRYKFLGHEFLTWLWYLIENDRKSLTNEKNEIISLNIGNKVVFDNKTDNNTENIVIKGDDPGLEEGIIALKKGGFVTEIDFLFQEGEFQWKFIVKGESFSLNSLKAPETGNIEKKDDIEGALLEKIYLFEKPLLLIEALYKKFIKIRLSPKWNTEVVPLIKTWISK